MIGVLHKQFICNIHVKSETKYSSATYTPICRKKINTYISNTLINKCIKKMGKQLNSLVKI